MAREILTLDTLDTNKMLSFTGSDFSSDRCKIPILLDSSQCSPTVSKGSQGHTVLC